MESHSDGRERTRLQGRTSDDGDGDGTKKRRACFERRRDDRLSDAFELLNGAGARRNGGEMCGKEGSGREALRRALVAGSLGGDVSTGWRGWG